MKIAELRKIIKNHKKSELEFLVAAFYKLIPKAKKEANHLDDLIREPRREKISKATTKAVVTLPEIAQEVDTFIEHAEAEYYYSRNAVIPTKEQSKWRFKVKRWYKSVVSIVQKDVQQAALADEILTKLYKVLCTSQHEYLLPGSEGFRATGIPQTHFLKQVLEIRTRYQSPEEFVRESLKLLFDKESSSDILFSWLIELQLDFLPQPPLLELAIAATKERYDQWREKHDPNDRFSIKYSIKRKLELYVEYIFRAYLKLNDSATAIAYYQENHIFNRDEVKLYILVRMLFEYQLSEEILQVINRAEAAGVEPREQLLKLRNNLVAGKALPEYM